MGNDCEGMCGAVNRKNQEKKKGEKGNKNGQMEFDVGFSSLKDDEFKKATKLMKERDRQMLEQISHMRHDEVKKALDDEINQLATKAVSRQMDHIINLRKQQESGLVPQIALTAATGFAMSKTKTPTTADSAVGQGRKLKQLNFNAKFLEQDDLLERMMSFKTRALMSEKKCEPNAFFNLKNSDELLWEDQTEHLDQIVLTHFISIRELKDYTEIIWEGHDTKMSIKRYSIEATILRTHNYQELNDFENDFFYNKKNQSRLMLLKQESILQEFHHYVYPQQLFRLQYGYTFLKVSESREINLKLMIQIRKSLGKKYEEAEVLSIMLSMLRAVRDANSIDISHGLINDENISIGQGGRYRLVGFGDLRIMKKKVNCENQFLMGPKVAQQGTAIKEEDHEEPKVWFVQENFAESDAGESFSPMTPEKNEEELRQEKFQERRDKIFNDYTVTYSFLRYHAHKLKPRHSIFWDPNLYSLMRGGLSLYYSENYENIKDSHDPEKLRFLGTDDEKCILELIMNQNIYSIAMVALQMMTLGDFEEDLCLKDKKSRNIYQSQNKSNNQSLIQPSATASIAKSVYGLPSQQKQKKEFLESQHQDANQNYKLMDKYIVPDYNKIMAYIDPLKSRYNVVIGYLKEMLKPSENLLDYKTLIQSLNEEEVQTPNDEPIYQEYFSENQEEFKNKLDEVVRFEKENAGIAIKSLDREELYMDIRRLFYQAQGYMIIRNYSLALQLFYKLEKTFEKEQKAHKESRLKYYNITNVKYMYISEQEDILLQMMKGASQLEKRNLDDSIETFIDLEGSLITASTDTLILINVQTPKFYQGLVTYYAGEPEDALKLFNRVMEISKGKLKEQDEHAYFHFIKIYSLLQLDSDGYYIAFKLLNEIIEKSQKTMIDALEMHQYFISDDLREKQSQNVSQRQIRQEHSKKVEKLNELTKKQRLGGANLPPPEKDNLTIRILVEIYDWLGYLYNRVKDEPKKQLCYKKYIEFAYNIIHYDKTQQDEYMLRIAKIKFMLKEYDECFQILMDLSIDLKRQVIDDFLRFEYQQIQSEIQIWMGDIYLLRNNQPKALDAYQTAKDELYKLKNFSDCLQNELKSIEANLTFDSNQKNEETYESTDFLLSLIFLDNEQQNTRTSQINLNQSSLQLKFSQLKPPPKTNPVLNGTERVIEIMKRQEVYKKAVEYEKMHQTPVLICLLLNYLKISSDCLAMGLKNKALEYMEECIKTIEKDSFFNSQLFLGQVKSSMKIDIFFYIGYLYGMNGQHELALIYYQQTFQLLRKIYELNQLDQVNIERMSLIYDQIGRVQAYQGFYKKSSKNFNLSFQMLQKIKKETSELQLAFKLANIGAIELRLGNIQPALQSTEQAIKRFEQIFGKISIPVITAKVKLQEILMKGINQADIEANLLKLIKSYKQLAPEDKSLHFEGQLSRMTGAYLHKQGKYADAFKEYTKAFVKLIDDNQVGEHVLSKILLGNESDKDYVHIKITDRAALEVCLLICQLYLDNFQQLE